MRMELPEAQRVLVTIVFGKFILNREELFKNTAVNSVTCTRCLNLTVTK